MEERAGHGAFASPEELGRVGVHLSEGEDSWIGKSDFDLLRLGGAEGINAEERFDFGFGERDGLGCVGTFESFQIVENFAGGIASHAGMGEETDAVRAVDFLCAGIGGEERFYKRELAEEGGGKKRRVRSVREQIF